MTVTSKSRPKVETEPTIQEHIDAMIVEAVRNAPPSLSVKEQRKKNQAAIEVLRQWREEDATDNPEELARREAD